MELKTAAEIQGKVIELQGVILAAQSSALAAQSDQFTLLEQIRELKAEMAKLEAWNAQKQRYGLKEIVPGSFAYVLKRSEAKGEPAHAVCAACYERGAKSILQDNNDPLIDKHLLECPSCRATVKLRGYDYEELFLD